MTYPIDFVIDQLVCIARPRFLRLHFVPVLGGVVVVTVEAGPLVGNDIVHPERVRHSRVVSFVAFLFVFVKALKEGKDINF